MMRGAGREAGFTLVDTIVGVAILGIGVTVVVGGMATSITVSARARAAAEAQIAVRSYAEQIAAATYVDCATSYSTAFTAPSGYTATQSVSYWDNATSTFVATCGTDSGLQRITLTVASTDGRASEVQPVAKRRRPVGET
ncbi:MAG: type II secretion system protein [Actinomycetota bacterium]